MGAEFDGATVTILEAEISTLRKQRDDLVSEVTGLKKLIEKLRAAKGGVRKGPRK